MLRKRGRAAERRITYDLILMGGVNGGQVQSGSRMIELLRCKMIERRSRGAPLEMSKSNLRGRRRMQRVSSESCWRRGLPGTTVRGLTARCSEINGHGRRLCEKDAPESCRTSWGAHDDRRGVSAAMGSKVSGESYDCSAPLLPVFELRMPRSAGLAPTRPSNSAHEHTRSTLRAF